MLETTYTIVAPPEPAMAWQDYASLASAELSALLTIGSCDERAFQALLEDHPILVPGVFPAVQSRHNSIFPASVITQPPLTGLSTKIPDFGVISCDSGTLYVTLVEIESPCKPWATKKGLQAAELTQAIGQLRDWKIWFKDPLNAARFFDEYQVPGIMRSHRAFVVQCVLVYGRRADLIRAQFAKRRAESQGDNEVFMTWDRIAPSNHYSNLLTVRLTPSGYQAWRVPPIVTLGPWHADDHSIILHRDRAVDASRHLSPARGRFLKDRWPYWDEWARNSDRGIRTSADHE